MRYFIAASSYAAPMFSDEEERYVKAKSAKKALKKFKRKHDHPAGWMAVYCFKSADHYKRGKQPLAIG